MTKPENRIDAEVDLRNTWNGVRDQGARATCLACATSDAHALLQSCPPLSAEFLFYHAIQLATVGNLVDGILFEEAAAALEQNGQPAEHEWPYSAVQPDPWTPPPVTNIWHGSLDHRVTDASSLVSNLVRQRQPVVLGIKISAALLSPAPPNFVITAMGDGFGGHAVLVVGLGHDTSGNDFLLIRNSWGNTWADGGYAWLAEGYLADKLIGFASITPRQKEK